MVELIRISALLNLRLSIILRRVCCFLLKLYNIQSGDMHALQCVPISLDNSFSH